MFGNLFKKKYPSRYLHPGPMSIIFTLPDKYIRHQEMNMDVKVFNNIEQQALYKLFRGDGRNVSGVTHLIKDTYNGEEFLCFAGFVRYGEAFWSDVDDLTSTMYENGPGDEVKNPMGMIKVREFEFFTSLASTKTDNSNQFKNFASSSEKTNSSRKMNEYKKLDDGFYTYSDGSRYKGEWKSDKHHGHGIYSHKNGNRYEGDWKDGMHDGHGTNIYPDGSRYVGQWKEHKHHCYGTIIYPDGSKYVGEWKEHKKDGKGIYFYNNGDKYSGYWKDGKKNGSGTYKYSDGREYKGEWQNDDRK